MAKREYSPEPTGGVTAVDTAAITVGGIVIDVVAKRVIAAALLPEIAVAAVAVAGTAAVGSALRDYLTTANLKPDPSAPSGLSENVGGTSITSHYYAWDSTRYSSLSGAIQDWTAYQQSHQCGGVPNCTLNRPGFPRHL